MDEQKSRTTPDAPEAEAEAKPGDKDPAADNEPRKSDELDFDEDLDSGGDPYNSTGSHVILELKKVSGGE